MRIALAQLNTTVGDLAGNEAKILAAYQRGEEAGVDMVVCPELSVTGYPPRDLLLKKRFIAQNLEVVNRLAAATKNAPRSNWASAWQRFIERCRGRIGIRQRGRVCHIAENPGRAPQNIAVQADPCAKASSHDRGRTAPPH